MSDKIRVFFPVKWTGDTAEMAFIEVAQGTSDAAISQLIEAKQKELSELQERDGTFLHPDAEVRSHRLD